ncbi:protoporphyrinogen oxidase [Litchfieldia alkalitelluris]|uniref:protoporphyrinogen oxidase n=1 Tax=Litchfieldia alkalitelluris TaxID=304268 RepID=UPI000998C845|nr:protoporphyrinogen oxidase [Litchfieldia alkalitelluris]
MSGVNQRVVIIGGGITGLTAAYYLQKEARVNGINLECQLLEASHKLGGKIQTVVKDGFVIEKGPDSFLARKKSAARLAEEVGIADKLVHNSSGKSFVLVRGKLYPMPGGSIMGIPTEVGPFITTGLFTPMGKLRASLDFLLPKSGVTTDQSLGQFFRRRLGDEVVDNLIEPLLSGIYAGDIDHLSLMSTFPQFYQVEQKHRSLVLGMKKMSPPKPKDSKANVRKEGMFLTISTGLQSFVERIESKLIPGTVKVGVKVEHIEKDNNQYQLSLSNGELMCADSVVIATPHQATQAMLSQYSFLDSYKEMPSTSVANVAMAFPKSAIKKDIDGTGFVVSRNNDYTLTACTWTHKKWNHSTPEGKVLLRCYVGGANDEAIVEQSDDEIIKVVLDDLSKTMDITEKPDFSIITRWKESMPQYAVGHLERLNKIRVSLKEELPGVFLAGGSYNGLGIPDCIDQGEAAVQKVLDYLRVNQRELVL